MIVIKRFQAQQNQAKKIVLLGGSSVLFGIDARAIEAALHVRTVNFGLNGAMRLDWLLAEADPVVRPGDTVVLALEPNFYECGQEAWTQWQLYNALAWNREYLPKSVTGRFNAVFNGGSVDSPFVTLRALWDYRMHSERITPRLRALAPPSEILARFNSGQLRTSQFAYSAYNTDDHGDMLNIDDARYEGKPADVNQPDGICADIKELLRNFIVAMRGRDVTVVFEYFPYLVDGTPQFRWMAAEGRFKADVNDVGGTLMGERDEFFFSRNLFFNTIHHLNESGRKEETAVIVRHLQLLGLQQHKDAAGRQ